MVMNEVRDENYTQEMKWDNIHPMCTQDIPPRMQVWDKHFHTTLLVTKASIWEH
jgi:hypothetical protein